MQFYHGANQNNLLMSFVWSRIISHFFVSASANHAKKFVRFARTLAHSSTPLNPQLSAEASCRQIDR